MKFHNFIKTTVSQKTQKHNRQWKMRLLLLICAIAISGFEFQDVSTRNMTGVYWGAFDPPTDAHEAIIVASVNDIPLKKLIVVVNNHHYKNYTYPLEIRLQLMNKIIKSNNLKNVEVLWQDDTHKIDFSALKEMTQGPLCAISGYDAYKKWVDTSSAQERSLYDAIAVIPRGDDSPILFDEMAFILPISPIYRHVSSTKIREAVKN
jgi:nicotinic acid mononucleotide adenylyltransferase